MRTEKEMHVAALRHRIFLLSLSSQVCSMDIILAYGVGDCMQVQVPTILIYSHENLTDLIVIEIPLD